MNTRLSYLELSQITYLIGMNRNMDRQLQRIESLAEGSIQQYNQLSQYVYVGIYIPLSTEAAKVHLYQLDSFPILELSKLGNETNMWTLCSFLFDW